MSGLTIDPGGYPRLIARLTQGVEHDGEMLKAERVWLLSANNSHSVVQVELAQGRNREVRRLWLRIDDARSDSYAQRVNRALDVPPGPFTIRLAAGTLRSDVIEDLTARATALLASAPKNPATT